MLKKNNRSFSLLEICVCLFIIGVLITVVVTKMRKVNKDLPVAVAIKDMTTIQKAITHGLYPDFGFIPTALDDNATDERKKLEALFIPVYLSLNWDLDSESGGLDLEREKLKTIKHIMPFLRPGNKYTSEGWNGPYLKPDMLIDATYFDEKRFPEGKEGEHIYMPAALTPWAEKCEENARFAEAEGDIKMAKEHRSGKYYHLLGRVVERCIEWEKDVNGKDICVKSLWEVPPSQACVVCRGQDGLGQTGTAYKICEKRCRDAGEAECNEKDKQCQKLCNQSYRECMSEYQTCLLDVSACRESYDACMTDYDACFDECKSDPATGYQDCIDNNCRSIEECCSAKVREFCEEMCRWPVNCGDIEPKPGDPTCHERCVSACVDCGGLTCDECNEGSHQKRCKRCSEANPPHPDGGWFFLREWKYGGYRYYHYGRCGSKWSRKYAFCGPCKRSECVELEKLYTFRRGDSYLYYDCGAEVIRCFDACQSNHCSHCVDKLNECRNIEGRCNDREQECPLILAMCEPDRSKCMQGCLEEKEKDLRLMPIECEGKCMQRLKITDPADSSYLDIGDDLVMFVFDKYTRLPREK